MTWWQALVLGLVEGITEYLPVSSTGHLILAAAFLGLDRPEIKPAVDAFLIVVQGGAILAVLGLYWPRVVQILQGLAGRDEAGRRRATHPARATPASESATSPGGRRSGSASFSASRCGPGRRAR